MNIPQFHKEKNFQVFKFNPFGHDFFDDNHKPDIDAKV